MVGFWCGWLVFVGGGFSFGARVFLAGLCGGVFVEGCWLVAVRMSLYVPYVCACYGAVYVRGGMVWACVNRVGY